MNTHPLTPIPTALKATEDPLSHPPVRHIGATDLHRRVKENAILIPLTDQWQTLTAYRIEAHGGPYLMSVLQAQLYKQKCQRQHLTQSQTQTQPA
jgi:hypothetical protein